MSEPRSRTCTSPHGSTNRGLAIPSSQNLDPRRDFATGVLGGEYANRLLASPLEYFGIFSDGRDQESTQHFISPGAHYLITPDWELGVRVGWGLNEQTPSFFANVGGGYRF